jgi:RNA recognition motif-containing protein
LNKKLYVGNLDWGVDDAKLKEIFSEAGEIVDAVVIKDKYSGKSRGFGFIEFADEESAKKAIDELNGKEVEGRTIVVNEAREKKEA